MIKIGDYEPDEHATRTLLNALYTHLWKGRLNSDECANTKQLVHAILDDAKQTTRVIVKTHHCGMCERIWKAETRVACPACGSDETETLDDRFTEYLVTLWKRTVGLYPWVASAVHEILINRAKEEDNGPV